MRFSSATYAGLLFKELARSSVHLLSVSSVVMLVVGSVILGEQPVQASTESVIFEVPIAHQRSHRDSVDQAELSAQHEISRRFKQNPELSTLQISVLVDRHGEVIPVFTTTVSREQWRQSPRIKAWSKYHNAYALLLRHNVPVTPSVARRPASRTVASVPRTARRLPAFNPAVDSAFDRAALPAKQVQRSLDYWD